VERDHILRIFRETGGVISAAAARLGIPRTVPPPQGFHFTAPARPKCSVTFRAAGSSGRKLDAIHVDAKLVRVRGIVSRKEFAQWWRRRNDHSVPVNSSSMAVRWTGKP
jgi:hypothetical protein